LLGWNLTSTPFSFGSFFNHIDHLPQEDFLYVTSGGIPAAKRLQQSSGAKTAGTESTTKEQDAEGQSRKTQKDVLAAVESDSETEGRLPDGGEEGG
jgi:tRNA pseudouridine38-40 synthase